jgi:hypothetical protein
MQPETFWTLLHDAAHWEFEVFLMVVFDGVIGYLGFRLLWPKIRKHWKHHIERDQREGVDKPRLVGTRQRITSQDVLGSFGIDEADVVSWELTNDTLTVVLRKQS